MLHRYRAPIMLLSLSLAGCGLASGEPPVITGKGLVEGLERQVPPADGSAGKRTFVMPHVLEKSGLVVTPHYMVTIDGRIVARREVTGDLDGDGRMDGFDRRTSALQVKLSGVSVDARSGAVVSQPGATPTLTLRFRPGRPGFGDIPLEKVAFDSAYLSDWVALKLAGSVDRKSISIVYLSDDGTETGRLNLLGCYPLSAREAGSGLATGRREAGSGLATGKREAGTGLATGRVQSFSFGVSQVGR